MKVAIIIELVKIKKKVRAYRSKDLCTFEDLGLIIPPNKDSHSPLEPGRCLDRPHIIYNQKTKKYVM